MTDNWNSFIWNKPAIIIYYGKEKYNWDSLLVVVMYLLVKRLFYCVFFCKSTTSDKDRFWAEREMVVIEAHCIGYIPECLMSCFDSRRVLDWFRPSRY